MTQREKVFKYVLRRKTSPTRAEIARALDITHPSACRRVEELLSDGRIVVDGQRHGAETVSVK